MVQRVPLSGALPQRELVNVHRCESASGSGRTHLWNRCGGRQR